MYTLNKIVGAIINPLGIPIVLFLFGWWLCAWRKRLGGATIALSGLILLFFSLPATVKLIGGWLEAPYQPEKAEYAPEADAIVLLGGGMCAQTNGCPYADMASGADRVWHAARLWHAKKAPLIVPTGNCERFGALPLLLDLGVPESVIVIEGWARNTEENARYTENLLCKVLKGVARPRVLLVTSAWHMRRAEMMFTKYAPQLDVVPCPTDFEITMRLMNVSGRYSWTDFIPDPSSIGVNGAMLKEIVGLVGYKVFR